MGAGLSMASVNKIKELANSREYSLALELVEHQDLTKSLNPQFLRLCGEIYIKNDRYKDARRCLIMAHRLGPESKRVLYTFVELYLRMGYFQLAKTYYDMYMFDANAYDSRDMEYVWNKHEHADDYKTLESYVFKDGRINYENLKRLSSLIGAEHLVLDLSCRKKDGRYYIVTDRWQKFTEEVVTPETLDKLAEYCSEYLIHAVDVEGKAAGIETELATMLGTWGKQPMTYAGGVGSFDDLESLKQCGQDRIDVTVGSALDIFGGALPYDEVVKFCS